MSDPQSFANPQLRDLVPYEPGKPIEDVARELGLEADDIVKLASNENPLGPSPMAVDAMQKGAVDFIQKPFRDQELLDRIREALATDEERREAQQQHAEVALRLDRLTNRDRSERSTERS